MKKKKGQITMKQMADLFNAVRESGDMPKELYLLDPTPEQLKKLDELGIKHEEVDLEFFKKSL